MRQVVYIWVTWVLLGLLNVQPVSAQDSEAANIKQLTQDMYRHFNQHNYEELKKTTDKLKEAALKAGDEKTFYKAWGNTIMESITFEGRPAALQQLSEMREHAISHNHKFGIYTANFVTAKLLYLVEDTQGAKEHYLKAVDNLKRNFPEESVAPAYNGLATLVLQQKHDSLAIYYAKLALADPHISKVHRVVAQRLICISWGWMRNKAEFDKAYDKLQETLGHPKKASTNDLRIVEVFRSSLNGNKDEALAYADKITVPLNRMLYTYKAYEWAGDYKNALEAHKEYRQYISDVNTREIRERVKLYQTELNVALAENEAKDLRLKNQQMKLDMAAEAAEHSRLEAEAAELKLKNSHMELANATMRLKNDSLDRRTQRAQLNAYRSRMEAQQQAEHTHHVLIAATGLIALLTIFFMALILWRRHRAAKRLKVANAQLQQAYDKLEETTSAKERLESELRIARDIQMDMLPQRYPKHYGLNLCAKMNPAKEVGGDLYDFFIHGNILYFCIGDVAGKGVPASMLMAVTMNLFRTIAKEGFPPEYVATKLNDSIAADNENGMFVTMFIGMLNLDSGRLDFCNAGHNPPLLNGQYINMEPNAPIGLWQDLEFVGEHLDYIKGKTLLLYTDGLTEAENAKQEQFGDERLQALLALYDETPEQTIERIEKTVAHHVGDAEASDDLTMLCLKLD